MDTRPRGKLLYLRGRVYILTSITRWIGERVFSHFYTGAPARCGITNIDYNRPISTADEQITYAVNVAITVFAGKSVMLIVLTVLRYSSLRDFVAKSITRVN